MNDITLIGGFAFMGVPQKWFGWFIVEHPVKMDENWGTPILGNLHLVFVFFELMIS